jgi:endonuclease/exonuclease/phosphatase family metal-dependent hydrolase
LNIWNLSGGWRDRRGAIVSWLQLLDADIVCLQEVIDDGARNSARWLAEAAGYASVAYAGVDVGDGRTFGPAILSRLPIDHERAYDLPNSPGPADVARVLLHARTGGIDVFSTHLTSLYESGRLRELQCLEIDRLVRLHAAPDAALPLVLAGDFNADPDSTEIRFLCGLTSLDGRSTYFQDAWRVTGGGRDGAPGWTWDNRNPFAALEFEPDRRIDYVFVGFPRPNGAGRVQACRVVCHHGLPPARVFPSDHFGLIADIATH